MAGSEAVSQQEAHHGCRGGGRREKGGASCGRGLAGQPNFRASRRRGTTWAMMRTVRNRDCWVDWLGAAAALREVVGHAPRIVVVIMERRLVHPSRA